MFIQIENFNPSAAMWISWQLPCPFHGIIFPLNGNSNVPTLSRCTAWFWRSDVHTWDFAPVRIGIKFLLPSRLATTVWMKDIGTTSSYHRHILRLYLEDPMLNFPKTCRSLRGPAAWYHYQSSTRCHHSCQPGARLLLFKPPQIPPNLEGFG
jgi:hypothetical protein